MTSSELEFERRALSLLEEALGVAAEERRAVILAATADDLRLQNHVLGLIEKHALDGAKLATGGASEFAIEEPIPDEVGGYRIEREIGRGGMGAVYLGRRITDEFDHVAAIKLVRADVASPKFIERLHAERRVLARLKHPNIAQMYDGGETAAGEPYFVMEYVEGVPLHKYLESTKASLESRLSLFLQICDAVTYAHQNLVIHRDLNPSNILIGEDRRVKLIDFGIAHSLGEDDPGESQMQQTLLTKGYAAPERKSRAAASTVTDIYSMGLILSELIHGCQAQRMGDVEAIAAKAHSLSPEARYQTVDALSKDLALYRRGGAVSAVNGDWRYSFARFAGRHRRSVAATVLAVAAVIASSVVISVLYFRADTAQQRATDRFSQVRDLATFMMFDLHDEVAKLDGSLPARQRLVGKSLDYLDALNASPNASVELQIEIAQGYKRLSELTGSANAPSLGDRENATALIEKAAGISDQLWNSHSDDAIVARAYADIKMAQAINAGFSQGDAERQLELMREARPALDFLV